MKNLQKGFIAPLLFILIAVLLIGGGVYAYVHTKQTNQSSTSVNTTIVTTSTKKSSTTSNSIISTIQNNIYQVAKNYLVTRLGSEYVTTNITVDTEKSEMESKDLMGYRIVFFDKKLTDLLNEKDKQVTYDIDITKSGKIDQTWMPINNDIPDCVNKPSLCEVHVTKEQAIAMVTNANYTTTSKTITTQLNRIRAGGGTGCTRSTAGEITSTEGFFWSFGREDSYQINISTGAVNICRYAIGDF